MRTFDAAKINEIANLPDIRPWIGGGDDPLDLAPLVLDPNNYTFVNAVGGFLLIPIFPGTYEAHVVFAREPKTFKFVLQLARKVLEYMFVETEAFEIYAKVVTTNTGADALCNHLRFQEQWFMERMWKGETGISYRKLDLDRWTQACSSLVGEGEAFHRELGREAQDTQNRVSGLAMKMIKAGNVSKGTSYFNRFMAAVSASARMETLSLNPTTIRLGTSLFEVRNNEMRAL